MSGDRGRGRESASDAPRADARRPRGREPPAKPPYRGDGGPEADPAIVSGDPDEDVSAGGFGPRFAIARRELASLRSEKTIVLALLIQLFVAAFSSFLVVGLVSLYDPGSVDGLRLEVGLAGNASDDVAPVIENQDGLFVERYGSESAALEAFQRGSVGVAMIADRTANDTLSVRAFVPDGSVRTTVMVVQVRDVLEALERRERARLADRLKRKPLSVPEKIPSSPYFGFTYTVLLPLLMFLPVFISGSVAVDSLTEEIQRGTLELLRVAPVSLLDIVDAKLAATAALAPAQAALWLVLLRANGTAIGRPVALVVVVAAFSLAVVTMGLSISLLARDRRQAQFLYSSGILLVVTATILLPEHPVNTVAKLAIDSPTTETWIAVGGYVVVGVATAALVRWGVERLDAKGL